MAGVKRQIFVAIVIIGSVLCGALLLSPSVGATNSPVRAVETTASTPGWETASGWGGTVSVDSPTDGWIVQYCNVVSDCRHNQVSTSLMHWDGTSWSSTTSFTTTYIDSVLAESPNDAWAAGEDEEVPGGGAATVLHWDGEHWTNSPITGAAVDSHLWALSADSPTDAWAVGYHLRVDGTAESFIVHWNGTTWSQVPSPSPAPVSNSYQLRSVSAVSSTDVWAVGFSTDANNASNAFILHWNGSNWLQFASPTSTSEDAQLSSVSATSSGAWAVGNTGNGNPTFEPLVLGLNGGTWSVASSPDPGGNITRLTAVSNINPTDAWLVGAYCPGGDCVNQNSLIEHWNGQVWAAVEAPFPTTSNQLVGLATDGTSDAWAVGSDEAVRFPKVLSLRWNGKRWSNFWPA
jgi:hypothetical protein